jgi:phage terminase large subunit-like protein
VASSEISSKSQKNKLAYSIANGKSISEWAKTNNVPRRTAYRWSSAPEVRDVMVEGPSGLIAVAPSWSRPRFESSKLRVEWPNGARSPGKQSVASSSR